MTALQRMAAERPKEAGRESGYMKIEQCHPKGGRGTRGQEIRVVQLSENLFSGVCSRKRNLL